MKASRRQALLRCGSAVAAAVTWTACRRLDRAFPRTEGSERLFFTSQGRTAMVHADGSGLRYFDFQVPDQVTWQPGPFLSDGHRMIFLSMEARRDGPGRPAAII